MNADFQVFRSLLKKAVEGILWLYFKTPVVGQTEEIFRERIFSYELYHQLRCVCDDDGFDYWMGGELDKGGHPIIRGDLKPDIVIHDPGFMERNLCVLEVKPITGKKAGFKKDINTLIKLVTQHSYHAGILLIFGDAPNAESVIKAKIGEDLDVLRRKNVFVLWVKNAQGDLVEL